MIKILFALLLVIFGISLAYGRPGKPCKCSPSKSTSSYHWRKFGDVWYTQISSNTWANQMRRCAALEPGLSSLASVRTEKERVFVKTKFTSNVWLGGFELETTNEWYWWTAGVPERITSTFWYTGQPGNSGSKQACITGNYSSKKQWDDQYCTSRHYAICEIRCPKADNNV